MRDDRVVQGDEFMRRLQAGGRKGGREGGREGGRVGDREGGREKREEKRKGGMINKMRAAVRCDHATNLRRETILSSYFSVSADQGSEIPLNTCGDS